MEEGALFNSIFCIALRLISECVHRHLLMQDEAEAERRLAAAKRPTPLPPSSKRALDSLDSDEEGSISEVRPGRQTAKLVTASEDHPGNICGHVCCICGRPPRGAMDSRPYTQQEDPAAWSGHVSCAG